MIPLLDRAVKIVTREVCRCESAETGGRSLLFVDSVTVFVFQNK